MVPVSADPDYAFQRFNVGLGLERTAGIGATILAVVALLILAWATRRHHLDPRWWRVLIPPDGGPAWSWGTGGG
jgi:uncharacterized protein (TIGR03382 family)